MSSTEQMSSTSSEPRLCENAECKIGKLIPMVNKQKVTQFVTTPSVVEKPLLINGLSAVFQTSGTPAKLADIKVQAPGKNENSTKAPRGDVIKPIYRIKPDTHVHIINYIVVDDDSDVLRKINESDPETLRILLDSQRLSAQQKLQKLMGSAKSPLTSVGELENMIGTAQSAAANRRNMSTDAPVITPNAPHPNLSIASVAEAVPFLAPVHHAADNLAPVTLQTVAIPSVPESSAIDKMQEELQELRRTVARLAAKANSQ